MRRQIIVPHLNLLRLGLLCVCVVLARPAASVGGQVGAAAQPTTRTPEAAAVEESPPASREEELRRARQRKAQELSPYVVSKGESRVRALEESRLLNRLFTRGWHGIHPVVGGMPSGSGLVGGAGYSTGLESRTVQFDAAARISTLGFRTVEALTAFPTPRSDLPVRAHLRASARDLRALNFFGFGRDSNRNDRSTFRQEDRFLGGDVALTTGRFVQVSAHGGWLQVETSEGNRFVSVDDRFDPATLSGFGERTEYGVFGGRVDLTLRDRHESPAVGVQMSLGVDRYAERDGSRFDFTRVIADAQAHVPLGPRSRILALRLHTSHAAADAGASVPFYLMDTVGGSRNLRGFSEYRFRDRNLLVANIEYRWEVWTYADLAAFVDIGKAFSARDEFDFSDVHTGYGIGIRGHGPGGSVLRIDLARSREGLKLHIGGGPRF